ncbi:MAG TPA: hypothetical protein VH165_20435 [Kofleriaceae bacterium]|jgi:hypothetical protein|nr:hypothetical protein [Kofleriaceae bacterium]
MSALRLNELLNDPSDMSIEISTDSSTIAMPRLERPAEHAGVQRLDIDATTAPTREMNVVVDPDAVALIAEAPAARVAEAPAVAPVPGPPAAQADNFYAISEARLPWHAHYATSRWSRALPITSALVILIALTTLASWFFGSAIR